MLTKNGGELLRAFSREHHQFSVTQPAPGVWFVQGLGLSNATFVEGETGVILIDTLDSLERGERLHALIRERTGKPVKAILYTHSHPDHTGGAAAFRESRPQVIAFSPAKTDLAHADLLQDVFRLRAVRQFGYALTDEEAISEGTGPREGLAYGEGREDLPPTTSYWQARVIQNIDGVDLELFQLPGETEDHCAVWLPQKGVLCCGDNYYGCFPNLYAIRGGSYRDIAAWSDSLGALLNYPADHLLPGHLDPISGRENIRETLTNFKGALDYLLTETLKGMNEGRGPDDLAASIRLPEEYAALPYLAEHYGSVEWTVRAIYAAYIGWFDGDPVHLHPLPPQVKAHKSLSLMGGREKVLAAAREAFTGEELQWCLELCALLLDADPGDRETLALKAEALLAIAELETSANGRHYYIACAKEILARLG